MQPPLNTAPCKLRGEIVQTRAPGQSGGDQGQQPPQLVRQATYIRVTAHEVARSWFSPSIPEGHLSSPPCPGTRSRKHAWPSSTARRCSPPFSSHSGFTPDGSSIFGSVGVWSSGYALTISVLTDCPDDWLIILPTLLSLALIGPSYKRQFCFRLRSLL